MNIRNIKQTARLRLGQMGNDPRMLVLLHTAVALGTGLLVTVLDFILTRSIDSTGGLAGLQLRSFLTTAQSVLQMASGILLPFWQIGIFKAAMAFARQEQATRSCLLAGFRRFRPVLRLMILRFVTVGAIVMVCTYAATAIFMATPFAQPVFDLLSPMISDTSVLSDPTAMLDEATMAALTDAVLLPLIPILMVLMAVLALPVLYRLRLADYILLDSNGCGARKAFGKSLRLTRRNGFALFRLDLSFWWFYLLQLACVAVGYLDVLLPLLHVQLPISGDSAFFAFYVLSLFLQLALYYFAGAYLHTAQALAYETLRAAEPIPDPAPTNQPWNY